MIFRLKTNILSLIVLKRETDSPIFTWSGLDTCKALLYHDTRGEGLENYTLSG